VRTILLSALAPALVCSFACSTPPPLRPGAQDASVEQRELEETFGARKALETFHGEASYYSDALAGRKTASGEPYDPQKYTAAHRSLPFGTVLRVRREDTGGIVYVRVNDRGPFGKRRRILDLSKAAAQQLGMIRRGIADVRIEVVERAKQ
jgi:rare lipoprotein A